MKPWRSTTRSTRIFSWSGPGIMAAGPVDFGSETSKEFRERILAPFFAYYLKDKGRMELAEATTFETGSDKWKNHDAWPPRDGISRKHLYFQADRRLSFD